jgi:type VI secretion system protein ImpF
MMAASDRKDRLNAPLMYAFRVAHAARDAAKAIDLRGEDGERILAGRRSASRGPISEPLLRAEVARDLEALMNTVQLESIEDLAAFDHVKESILNFGLPDLVHRSIDEGGVDEVRGEIEAAITRYEPRLVPKSLQIARDRGIDSAELKVRFIVQAELRCDPVDVPVEFVADLDVDGTVIQIHRL